MVFCVALRGYNGHTIKPHLKMCSLISFDTCETITTVREDTAAPRGPILPLGHLRSFFLTLTPSHPTPARGDPELPPKFAFPRVLR